MMCFSTLYLLKVATAFGLATAAAAPLNKPPSLVLPGDASTSTPWTLNDDESSRKVLLTLGVMSRCPDAHLVERLIARVVRDKRVADKVALDLVFIGREDEQARGGVRCMHGVAECDGNRQQLCTIEHLSQKEWWTFVQCQDYSPARIGTLPLATECAKLAGFTWSGSAVEACAEETDGDGERLLRKSVRRTKKLGIEKSATVLLGREQKVRCIHDGTWKSCDAGHTEEDFVRSILKTWDEEGEELEM